MKPPPGDGIGKNADGDSNGVDDNRDAFPLNKAEHIDIDGDGIGNNHDRDDDNDGVLDTDDRFPLNRQEIRNVDGDGKGDNRDTDYDTAQGVVKQAVSRLFTQTRCCSQIPGGRRVVLRV